ncbi:MAG: hypothetical protein GIW98_01275 [Candidatus Eremiobacteraeota bacterium]|nr:hypothetical protein [Candidatus Eremiobacteraeota bacterium]
MEISRRPTLLLAALFAVLAVGCGGGGGSSGGGGGGLPPPQPAAPIRLSDGGIVGLDDRFNPVDGDTPSGGHGQVVGGIDCGLHNIRYHIHLHVSLFVNGTRLAVPDTIGILNPGPEVNGFTQNGSCFYHLHTHDAQGLVHVEAPAVAQYTLGQFFDIWGQPLSNTNVAGNTGSVQVYIAPPSSPTSLSTGPFTPYTGDPRAIPLQPHEAIVLEVGPTFVVPPGLSQIIFQYN